MPPKKKKPIVQAEVKNFYELDDVQAFCNRSHNPYYELHGIKVPFRMAIIGGSGSYKTGTVMNIISKMNQTFNNIEIFCRCADEPLYNYLKTKIDPEMLTINEGLGELNKRDLNEYYKSRGSTLIIFDDLCLERDQSKIGELFIRGRKLGNGVSLIYISQKYFKIPKEVRGQLNYIILKKISGKGDLARILSDTSLGATKEQLLNMYKYCCCQDLVSFMLIDLETSQDKTYRKNFVEYLNPEMF
jgi:hypothetical protein